jgi:hypothetical protein
MVKPKTFAALVRAGGPDRCVREAAQQAASAGVFDEVLEPRQ